MRDSGVLDLDSAKIAVVGLGYAGLPLAVELGKKYDTLGFDIDAGRVSELAAGQDITLEVTPGQLANSGRLTFSCSSRDMAPSNLYILAVPTPIDAYNRPDLGSLMGASTAVGKVLSKGDLVVYESTVYPGATEEDCVPVLERESGLTFNRDFWVGYSPERISPGDRQHRITQILKVTSGSTPEAAKTVDALYGSIIPAGTHLAPSIRVAEAAKVIENIQRDLNIALINELAMIFHRLGIDTADVLAAAGTKWNFLPFKPGLVGGHCIGVDPYYLTHKAQSTGYHPDVILAGRRINDGMPLFVVAELVKEMLRRSIHVDGARILVLGVTFKENCPDIRNSRVPDVVEELHTYNAQVDVYDPWASKDETFEEYGIDLISQPKTSAYDAMIFAVAHGEIKDRAKEMIRDKAKRNCVVYDLKHMLSPNLSDLRL